MLTTFVLLLLMSAPAESTRLEARTPGECEDVWRIELSPSTAATQRICVSPGIMTGLLFDHPVVVEFQDEERFVEVTRGRNGVSFVPPRDMLPGEQLRLTASLQVGEVHQNLTIALVAHAGQATHQVEIYHDKRTWQSLHDELSQAWVKNKRLQEENEALHTGLKQAQERLALSKGLRGTWLDGQIDRSGISVLKLELSPLTHELSIVGAATFLSHKSAAIEVRVVNNTRERWPVTRATLTNEQGRTWEAVRLWPSEALVTDEVQSVFMEFETSIAPERVTLVLGDEGPHGITIPGVVFPKAESPSTPP